MKVKNFIIAFFLATLIFLRITPIINKTVPYTYDQGRDFLKVVEIIRYKNLTFIGPTTGIMGVYHGAWWYYLLAIPYIIFKGNPMGYYYFLFAVSFIVNIFFFLFIKKEFGFLSSLVFLGLVSTSQFFIQLSFYASNNTIAPLLIPLLIISLYEFFKTKKNQYLFFVALTLGFILEFELAFGLFIIIATFVSSLFFKEFRKFSFKKISYVLGGIIIPVLPRILFELKNHLRQTINFINFYKHPTATNSQLFNSLFNERVSLFVTYFKDIFFQQNMGLVFIFLLLIGLAFFIGFKKLNKYLKKTVSFIGILISFLFVLSLFLYRNNFFWKYYFDGLQYLYLFIIVVAVFILASNKNWNKLIYMLITILFIVNIAAFKDNLKNETSENIGIKKTMKVISYLTKKTKNKDFCLRIYTPPIVPYTYNYLLDYQHQIGKIKSPKNDFYQQKCWYIIEGDRYGFRVKDWQKKNIPQSAQLIKTKEIDDIQIKLYKNN